MTCGKCKKESVCFIIREFEKTSKLVYPWWEARLEKLNSFVGENCAQFEPFNEE